MPGGERGWKVIRDEQARSWSNMSTESRKQKGCILDKNIPKLIKAYSGDKQPEPVNSYCNTAVYDLIQRAADHTGSHPIILLHLTRVGSSCNGGAKGGAERVGGNGRWWLLDTGGCWVNVVAGGHRAGGGQGFQGCHLPLRRGRLAVHSGGRRTVRTLHSYWCRDREMGRKEEVRRKSIRARPEQKRSGPGDCLSKVLAGQAGSWFQ